MHRKLLVGVCLLASSAWAHAEGNAADSLGLNVVKHTLDNGLRVLIVERHDTPTVATYLQFDVGGVDDPKGQSGIAHLLEHMMFKGTSSFGTSNYEAERPLMARLDQLWADLDAEHAKARSPFQQPSEERILALEAEIAKVSAEQKKYVIKNELWQAYQRLGGTGLNASTGNDSTQYYVELPSNQLRVWAHLESDRLRDPVFREFYSERDVVHEERRLRTDTQPRGLFREAFMNAAYIAHPYRNPVVGWSSDIDSTVREEVLQYFKTFYAPNNAVAVLVGDVDADETLALMKETFGKLPAGKPPRRNVTVEPEHQGERRFAMKLDSAPQIQIGYLVPEAGDPAAYALTVAAEVLSGSRAGGGRGRRGGGAAGGSGRLFKHLVLDQAVALDAGAGVRPGKYPGLFSLNATPAPGVELARLEAALDAEIQRLIDEPPSDEELARVRNAQDAALVRGLRSNSGIARAIGSAEMLAGDWRFLTAQREAIKRVTAEDVVNSVKTYLVRDRRTVGWLESAQAERRGRGRRAGGNEPGDGDGDGGEER